MLLISRLIEEFKGESELDQNLILLLIEPQIDILLMSLNVNYSKWLRKLCCCCFDKPEDNEEKETNVLQKMNNVEFESESSSTSLIKWCDMMINFGSSIGLEAIYQEKNIIYPRYLHSNQTIHDVTYTTHTANSSEEVYKYIDQFSSNQIAKIPKEQTKSLLKKVVYGSKEPHDILDFYYKSLKEIAQKI